MKQGFVFLTVCLLVHPNQITPWEKQLLESLPELFSRRRQTDQRDQEALTSELYQQIGQLKVELDWLKKKSGLDDKLMDEQYVKTPFYGIDKMTEWLCQNGHSVNHNRVRRLMRQMSDCGGRSRSRRFTCVTTRPLLRPDTILGRYFEFYNNERLHQALGYRSPAEVYGVAVGTPVALRSNGVN